MTSAIIDSASLSYQTDQVPSPELQSPVRQIVFGLNESLARDFVQCLVEAGGVRPALCTVDDLRSTHSLTCADAPLHVVVFATSQVNHSTHRVVDLLRHSSERQIESLTLVHPCGALLGEESAVEQEELFRTLSRDRRVRVRIVRCGVVLSPGSAATRWARRWGWLSPLLSETPATPFVPVEMLTSAVDAIASKERLGDLTLLGPHRAWRDVLREQPRNFVQRLLAGLAWLLSWLFVGLLARLAFRLAQRWSPRCRVLDFREVRPTSAAELVSLFNRWTAPHVQVAGYNNGVTHFGWRFPGKTLVTTRDSGRVIRIQGDRLTVDAGVTLKRCLDALAREGRDLLVAPNFSYVAAGTAFFVPIHGSGCEVSTLGDTIERVLFYDPRTMRFVRARRGEPAFAEAMYNRGAGLLLLRLTLRTRPKARYIVTRERLAPPEADQLLAALSEPDAGADPSSAQQASCATSNVEIRKSRAADDAVEIARYCIDPSETSALDSPRDRLGRVWDRLEENRVGACLFHAFVRTCAYHVELFMTPDEFRAFWKAHRSLPVSKIQLRRVRKDGMPHSPMRSDDLVSADLFMMRRHRPTFLAFVRQELPAVRFNPGKQSLGETLRPS